MVSPIDRSRQNLNALVHQLWSIAQGKIAKDTFPVRICDDAATVKAIFADPHIFKKNYAFLDSFAVGRFSDNYPHWTSRAPITQSHYVKNEFLKGDADVADLYQQAFDRLPGGTIDDVNDAAISAAVSVISRAFGLKSDIPWDCTWVLRVRNALGERQSVGFYGTTPERFEELGSLLDELKAECIVKWNSRPDIIILLDGFRMKGKDIPDFDPVSELIQNIIAATETTAATISWAAVVLACRPDLQHSMQSGGEPVNNFVQELLRLYPPVPFVTRYAAKDISIGNVHFVEGEAIVVSVFGLHYSDYWQQPGEFRLSRFAGTLPHVRDHYLPFLSGPRACGGRRLAELELNAAIKVLVDSFDFTCDEPGAVGFDYGLSFRPVATSFNIIRRSEPRDSKEVNSSSLS